jgi:Tol biopolymer transport system component
MLTKQNEGAQWRIMLQSPRRIYAVGCVRIISTPAYTETEKETETYIFYLKNNFVLRRVLFNKSIFYSFFFVMLVPLEKKNAKLF